MSLESYLESNKKSHLIFDLDETIVHLIMPWERYFDPIKDQLISFDRSLFEGYERGEIGLNELEDRYVFRYGKIVKKVLVDNKMKFESENLETVRVNISLIDFIRDAQGYRLFIWSNNTILTIEKVLEKQKIYDRFSKIVSYNDQYLLKPNPEAFAIIYDDKIPKEKYLFVGDSLGDRKAAENFGIDFYYVDYFKDPNVEYNY